MTTTVEQSYETSLKLAVKAVMTVVVLNGVALFGAISPTLGRAWKGEVLEASVSMAVAALLLGTVISWGAIISAYFSEMFYLNAAALPDESLKKSARQLIAVTAVFLILAMICFIAGVLFFVSGM